MAKRLKTKLATHQAQAARLSVESSLSDDALHFLRRNPASYDNLLVLEALCYMDDCTADSEVVTAEELEKETDAAFIKGEEEALEMFEVLLDAALYYAKFPNDADNIKDLIEEAAKCEKYRNNVRNN